MSAAMWLAIAALAVEDWPQWRGPSLDGSTPDKSLPISWSEKENILWKARLPSWSGSTPAIWGSRIFVASPSAAGSGPQARNVKSMGGARKPEGLDLLLLCLSKKDGSELWRVKLDGGNYQIGKQNMSTPSPVTDGKMVWALTGTGILTALDMDGRTVWKSDLQKTYGKFGLNWGYGASPLLYAGMLIVPVLHGMHTKEPSYLVAFQPEDGKVLWRVERPTDARAESPDAYTTPVVWKAKERTEILILGGDYITGHDPATGQEIWRSGGVNPEKSEWWRSVASPVAAAGMAFACVKKGPVVACRTDGRGTVPTEWTSDAGYDVPTPVSDGAHLYILADGGLMSCLDPKTGKAFYKKERLPRGTYTASPLLGDGKIYVTSEAARTTVLAAGPEFKILAQNQLDDDYSLSSIAVSGSRFYLRSSAHLYAIGQ